MYVTIKYRKRGGGEREEGLKKLSASRMDKKERRRKERKKTRSANTRERERESKLWRRRWGPVGDEHIGGGRGRRRRRFARAVGKGGRSEVEKKIARRLFSCRNFYWRVRHVGPTGGGGKGRKAEAAGDWRSPRATRPLRRPIGRGEGGDLVLPGARAGLRGGLGCYRQQAPYHPGEPPF